jgi:fumarate reductase flavoprotein subunit
VLVIGGGLAGLCALNSALEQGATAMLIEKTDNLGGSTVLSSGLVAFTQTDEQHDKGVVDSLELLRHDLEVTGLSMSEPALLDAYCVNQLDTYRWLKEIGVVFGEPHAGSGQSVPRSHPIDTWNTVSELARRARARGAVIDLETAATRFVMRGDDVTGVLVTSPSGTSKILAGAVVLASGGFSRSEELLERIAPAMAPALRAGGEGNTGDGLMMAAKIGAGQADLPFVKGTFGIFPFRSAAEEGTGILAVYKGAIAVNGYGQRFINESLPYKVLGDACLAQPESLAYQIFDEQVMAQSESLVPIYNFRRRLEAGQVREAPSLEELANELGIDADTLLATVRDYNVAIASGSPDAFARATLCGGVDAPTPITTPPFYGYASTTVVLATYCGVTFDPETRVTDVYREPIPGLYAAGEVTGGFHGNGYVTGSSLGKSAIFGRIAGRNAALFARSEL